MNENLLSRKKRSAGAPHDAARKRASFGAGRRNGIPRFCFPFFVIWITLCVRSHTGSRSPAHAGNDQPASPTRPGDYFAPAATASLNVFPAVKAGTVVAAILMIAPVWGLRPSRAARAELLKVPKPGTVTSAPDATVLWIMSMYALTARSASALVMRECCNQFGFVQLPAPGMG